MTLPYSPSRAVYAGNGTATVFPFAFKVWSEEQLVVSVTSPQGVTSVAQGWSAALNESGGAVTYLHEGAPLPEGWRLAIVRDMPFGQDIDLVSATRFDAQVIEDGLDQACAERQELRERLARAVVVPVTSDETPEELMQSMYESRDAAASNASDASDSADAAAASALLAQAWAQSPTPPDAEDADSKSARTWAGLAAGSADDAAASESNAAGSADRAQAWAESPAPPDPEDPDSKSAKTWAAIAADTVPIATPTLAGKVKPDGATIEIAQDGGISVPAATTATRGLARLATPAEVQAGAAAAGSPAPAVLRPEDIAAFPAVLGGAMLYNTREVLTVSGSWTVPVTGWYRIVIIGGGGAGGSGSPYDAGVSGYGGLQGGATTFLQFVAQGGSGGGGSYSGSGGGGEAGEVIIALVYLEKGSTIPYTIGAGGSKRTTYISRIEAAGNGEGPNGGHGNNNGGGDGARGAWPGVCQYTYGTNPYGFCGGHGGSNHTGFGGGGGGGCGSRNPYTKATCPSFGGRGGDNGQDGETSIVNNEKANTQGGAGGPGAVIIEYFDPAKAA